MSEPIRFWRSFEEMEAAREAGPSTHALPFSPGRREFLKLAAAAAALASAGCHGPVEEIVPHVHPTLSPPGVPVYFATSHVLGGYASGILVRSDMGRPTKVEGNPAHPASLGATDIYAQASILQVWDPDRSSAVRRSGAIVARGELDSEWHDVLARLQEKGGEGLRILAARSGSPAIAMQRDAVLKRFPAARWHEWEPLHRDASLEGARIAFGRALEPVHRFDVPDVVLALDADFLGEGPGHLRNARDFVSHRKPAPGRAMCRLYAVEPATTLTGAMADHRVPLPPGDILRWLAELEAQLHGGGSATLPLVAAVARELSTHRGRALIVAGESLPPQAHALVHALNAELGAAGTSVAYVEPVAGDIDCTRSIRELAADLDSGKVSTLVILGANPVYDAPADLHFARSLARAPLTLHHGLYEDETAVRCTWHVPAAHFLEDWSDARAFDGTASLVQPLIAPLHGGISRHEILALLAGTTGSARDLVRARWQREQGGPAFEEFWERSLRDGVVANTASTPVRAEARRVEFRPPAGAAANAWSVRLSCDPSVRDGAWANNAWLQELPRPDTKLTWDNAVLMSVDSARKLGVTQEDFVEIAAPTGKVTAPVWLLPGHAEGCVTLSLGYGRTHAGRVGTGVGVDAYVLRAAAQPWVAEVTVRKVAGRHQFATTQNHARMEGREPVRVVLAADVEKGARIEDETPKESLYPQWAYPDYRWGMAVDLNACIGCNACTIACQAENNIPTVGPEQVIRGREMHWIRVDRYYDESQPHPRTYFQPVPCMQCEDAPCEAVCPVGATVHDSEGINVQVYNRCVGTRFCSNNCPYKVRRFNFLHFAAGEGEPPLEARNPEVTVRMRGVMEKCNYCLQRITRARIETDREGRRIADGEVVTACQAVCPTRAITFGDLNDPQSAVNAAKKSPLDYALLAELNTRPRTTYLARILNPNSDAGKA
ncbi:MAG TPA: 4Fe-4S dicluster domain-containing protein [Usitatibacter sp.]|nr:4Fe-4S dicluster domain-containing protein [Usitatibacter sp.]